jgi:hypothetical protein
MVILARLSLLAMDGLSMESVNIERENLAVCVLSVVCGPN